MERQAVRSSPTPAAPSPPRQCAYLADAIARCAYDVGVHGVEGHLINLLAWVGRRLHRHEGLTLVPLPQREQPVRRAALRQRQLAIGGEGNPGDLARGGLGRQRQHAGALVLVVHVVEADHGPLAALADREDAARHNQTWGTGRDGASAAAAVERSARADRRFGVRASAVISSASRLQWMYCCVFALLTSVL